MSARLTDAEVAEMRERCVNAPAGPCYANGQLMADALACLPSLLAEVEALRARIDRALEYHQRGREHFSNSMELEQIARILRGPS